MAGVVVDRVQVAVTQPKRRLALPLVAEPAYLGQFVADRVAGDQFERATGADGGKLPVVAGQQQFRPGGLDMPVDLRYGHGVGHRGLVDHDQVAGAKPPPVVLGRGPAGGEPLLGGQPSGDVAGL